MTQAILVFNAGSSSLKFSVFLETGDAPQLHLRGRIEALHAAPRFLATDASGAVLAERGWDRREALGHGGALDHILGFLHHAGADLEPTAVGHRVVHGGTEFHAPVRVDAAVLARLQRYVALAPLHQPHNLAPIAQLLARMPDVPQVACFDTAFHRTNPDLAQLFALPYALFEQGVRRYGFHGLSYEYIASALARHSERAARGRTVVLHLGNGASMCALHGGRSIATTMGFTALDGLMMGTRCGNVDPGVLLYLMDRHGMDARALESLLYHDSGLLGVSGLSGDMRTLLASDAPRARLAIDLYCYRIGRELGSLVAALGGVDALVFTGGIGENAAAIRARVLDDAGWLGVEIDTAANAAGGPLLTTPGSPVAAYVMPTDEERMIAGHALHLIRRGESRQGATAA